MGTSTPAVRKMAHGSKGSSKGKMLEEKQLRRYRRSLKRTRAKSRNPSADEENGGRRPAVGACEKVDGCRRLAALGKSSGDPTGTSSKQQGPRPATTPVVNQLKPPAVDVSVSQEGEEEDVEQTIPLLSTDDIPTSDQELRSLETASKQVKAPVSVIVTRETKDLEKTLEQEPPVGVIVTQAEEDQKTTTDKPISPEQLKTKPAKTAQPIKVIVTQEEDEDEALKKSNEDSIVRLEEMAAKAKAVASWKKAFSSARKPVALKEEKTNKSAAAVEEAEEIVASDNLKVIDPAAEEVLTEGKAVEENTADSNTGAADVKVEKPAVGRNNTEEIGNKKEEFNFEESLGWTVQARKGRKGKKGLSKLKGIISELKAEEAEKKKEELIEEPKVLSFEEAALEVEAESAFARRNFAASHQSVGDLKKEEDVDTDSSGWEVIEVSDESESEDEVREVVTNEEVKERMSEEENGCSSKRWVEEMNEKNRKKMEMESKATDSSTSYSQSNFWREPISQLANMPNLPKEEKKEEEKKPAGISLPTSEMTYDWMEDDAAMGAIDTDEEDVEEVKEKKPEVGKPLMSYADAAKKVEEVKAKGIALPTEEMTFDWMNDDEAMGTMDSDDDDDIGDNRGNLTLDLKKSPQEEKDEVGEQYSPVQYWRDPIPDILDPEEPLKNAEKSKKTSQKPKPITPKAARPKSWLASNMAGMFDRKPKPKVKTEQVAKKSEEKTPASAEIKDVKPSISSSSTVTGAKEENKESAKPATIQTESNQKQSKPKIEKENVWLDKWKFDDAEARFYEKESCNVERESSSTEVENKKEKGNLKTQRKGRIVKEITEETHEKVEVVYKVPEKMGNKEMKEKLISIESENKEMRTSLAQLSEYIRALTARVNLLEKESCDEGVDLSFPSPTGSAPFCPHYTDCTCLANRSHPIL